MTINERDINEQQLSEKVRTLKEAFPSTDVGVIEAVLQAQNDNLEIAFESLLSISDPQQLKTLPDIQKQVNLDEEYAKKLAIQEETRMRLNKGQHSQQQQTQQQDIHDHDPAIFNFQEELPIIKERVIEAGNAAKKKVIDLYNQLKATQQKDQNNEYQYQYGYMSPIKNARHSIHRGLTRNNTDDLLTGDVSAIYLSDHDVYVNTNITANKAHPPPPLPPRTKSDKVQKLDTNDVPPLMSPRKTLDTKIKEKSTETFSPYIIEKSM